LNKQSYNIADEQEEYFTVIYIQGAAALEPAPLKLILQEVTVLKVCYPTQKMDKTSTMLFLKRYCELLLEDGFCTHAIVEGIKKFMKEDNSEFFPKYKTLKEFISPIHWKLKTQIEAIGKLLETKKQKVLTKGEKK
jgi:pyoverdine/dityrosine biosynthesis protein Dit1